ncbi:MAG: septum formation protein Maf [Oscillospiraceae bacterium]|jgi:septum formation protein|nr:septum formation protein Maf [Oscillospiraceae bacterium]MBQ2153861.1 septum formation protein Maf [Oscillospiraceae bacterium]
MLHLILGSQSPRRRELLRQIGLTFEVRAADIDETPYETDDPEQTVRATCAAKAEAVAARSVPGDLILTSDTIVALDGKILGKPHSAELAVEMLTALSGREHTVYTAFTLRPVGGSLPVYTGCEHTLVRFRRLTEEEIRGYVATGEPMDKAGAYGIQGRGAVLVEGITGDYFTVMGLPVCRVAQKLKEYGFDPLSKGEDR